MITAFFQVIQLGITTALKVIEFLVEHPIVGVPVALTGLFILLFNLIPYFVLLVIGVGLLALAAWMEKRDW